MRMLEPVGCGLRFRGSARCPWSSGSGRFRRSPAVPGTRGQCLVNTSRVACRRRHRESEFSATVT